MIENAPHVTCLGNIPWLSKIPSHWKVVRSKRLFTVRKERAFSDDEQLSATQAYGVISQAEYEKKIGRKVVRITQHLDKRAHVEKDDFVISMRSFQGGLERAWARGCIRSSYVVLQPAPEVHINYFAHLFKSHDYIRALQTTSNFIRDGQDLNFRNFSLVDLPLPPMEEQIAIGRFLDHADRRIRRYIRAKRQLIALLNEQKQAIIHRAVTRGLDPNVKLKPSGVEWLGEVPEHWETRRLRYLIEGKLTYGANAAAEHTNLEWPRYLRITDFGADGSLRPDTFRSLAPELARDYLVQNGDLLFARSGATVGKAFLVTDSIGEACHAGYLIRCRVNRACILPEFLFQYTQSTAFARWKDATCIIATIQNIGADKYADLSVPVPPLHEQAEITSHLDVSMRYLRSFIAHAESEISLTREYRTRLIADVVTGKVDVREAAAALPDEQETVEPDADELLGEDEASEGVDFDSEPEEIEA